MHKAAAGPGNEPVKSERCVPRNGQLIRGRRMTVCLTAKVGNLEELNESAVIWKHSTWPCLEDRDIRPVK